MMNLIEQIKHGQIWDFHGGIHPPENKRQSSEQCILPTLIPDEIILPITQHKGESGELLVTEGERVLKGQPLTQSFVLQCVPVHAPTSGTVTFIGPRPIAHPSNVSEICIVIEPDYKEEWTQRRTIPDYLNTSPESLISHIRNMGISGMGGAGFPVARKLQTAFGKTGILIINGAECEPYITADDRLMRENAFEIIEGIEILRRIVKPSLTIVAVEDNKPEAIKALKKAIQEKPDILVQVVPTQYPSGGEKQLVKIITGKEVPSNAIPTAIGVMVQNIATVYAIKRAVANGEALIERVVTLTGNTLAEQRNRWVLFGTPISFLLEKQGYVPDKKQSRLIIGGPMMGFPIPDANVPVTKLTSCVLVPSRKEMPFRAKEMNCIRCGSCADVCPVSLLPQQLQWYAKDHDFDKCQYYNLFDCIECGACAYVCPSEIPLVTYYQNAKAQIYAQEAEKLASTRARERFVAKNLRLEREKQERTTRHKQAAENRRQTMQGSPETDLIAAAIARVKAKTNPEQLTNTKTPQPLDEDSPLPNAAGALKEDALEKDVLAEDALPEDALALEKKSKKDLINEAIARTKARKAAQLAGQMDNTSPTILPEESEKEAITQAVPSALIEPIIEPVHQGDVIQELEIKNEPFFANPPEVNLEHTNNKRPHIEPVILETRMLETMMNEAKNNEEKTDEISNIETMHVEALHQEIVIQETTHIQPTQIAPVQIDLVQIDLVQMDLVQIDPVQTDLVQTDLVQTELTQTAPVQTDLVQTDLAQTDPVQTDLVQTDLVQTDLAQTDPVQTDPIQIEPVQTNPTDLETSLDKATHNEEKTDEPTPLDPKKIAIAAAILRAKERKAALTKLNEDK